MSEVLYRKYRSKSFSEIIGQDTIVKILTESILKGNVSHAYLFCGPRGTGKTSLARIFSRAINCDNFSKKKDVCNECESCRTIIDGKAIDIIEMDAASNRGIEEIRNLKDSINYLPTLLKKKIYIIDEVHMLTKEAFNALLKTLEEPPEHVIFILATTEPHKIPITILSRVQRFDLSLASKKDLVKKLKKIVKAEGFKAEDSIWDILYSKSSGSFRDAESLLGKVITNVEGELITKEYLYDVLGIYSDDEINGLIDSIEVGDIELFQKGLANLSGVSGGINGLIDQLIEKLYSQVILALKNSSSYYSKLLLINHLIKVKKDLKDFSDKRIIFELSIISFIRGKDQDNNIKSSGQSKVEERSELPKSTIEVNVPNNQDDISLNEMVISSSKIKLPRLRAILSSSNFEIDGQKLRLFNKYKFNIDFLKKNNADLVILDILANKAIIEVEFVHAKDQDIPKEEEVKSENNSQRIKEGGEIDNSDIIEGILL